MNKQLLSANIAYFCLSCLIVAQTKSSHHKPKFTVDDLLQVSSVVSFPRWSPDGSWILFSSSLNNGGLMIIKPHGGFPIRVPLDLGGLEHFLSSHEPEWSPDGNWISYVSVKSGTPEIWLWSVSAGQHLKLTSLGGRINSLNWSPDSGSIAFSNDRYGNYDIWTVTIPQGEVTQLTEDRRYEVFPTWTPDSRKILYVRLDDHWVDHDIMEMAADGSRSRLVVSDSDFFDYGAGRSFGYPLISPDGTSVLFRSQRSGWINYWLVPLSGGETRPMAEEKADQSEACWSPDGKSIAYISNYNGTLELRAVSSRGGHPKVLVAPRLGVCTSPEWSPDATKIAYVSSSPTHPQDLFTVSLLDGEIRQLTHSIPFGSLEKSLVEPDKITYQGTDNIGLSAYLFKPFAGREGEKFPAIIWLHGGPTSQFTDAFQQHVQFFVQNGYVVLLPNVRGSSGYGKSFEKANYQSWGQSDLQDVLAGVAYLKSLPCVNPQKLGVTGTSYGGILTMATIANAPGVFQAAIPCSGDADWERAYQDDELRHVKMWDYELGPLEKNRDLYRDLSPISHVERITTPTFILHGEGLYPESPQSKIFAAAMQKYYKVFRYKAYRPENYYVRSLENRRQMLLDMLNFFDQFLKDRNPE